MEAMRDRAPTECPSCGEFFDPRAEEIELSVTEEGESRVSCPHCGARFHLDAEQEPSEPSEEEL